MLTQILIKKNIQENLPYGSFTAISKTVQQNFKKTVSISHVRNVCNPDKTTWDADVITVAQAIILKRQGQIITAKENLV